MRARMWHSRTDAALSESRERLITESELARIDGGIDDLRHHWWCLDTRCRGCAVERGGW